MANWMDIGLGVGTGGLYNMNKALLGGLSGGRAPNFDSLIDRRNQDIDSFQRQLTMAQNNILSNYQNLQTTTMNRFMPDYTAHLAGRGLAPNGGAFASAVAHEATGLQGQYDALNANMTENNLNTIGQMRQNLFGQTLGLQTFPQMAGYQNRQGLQQAFGNLAGVGLGAALGGPMGAGIGGRSIFGGGSGGSSSYSIFGNTGNGGPGNLNLPMKPMGGGYGYNLGY